MRASYAIGLDVGGTKIEGVLVNRVSDSALPRVLKKIRLPTHPGSREKTVGNIVAVVYSLYGYGKSRIKGFRLKGIGLGTAGFLRKGRLEMVPNIPALKGIRLREVLSRQLRENGIKSPLFIENDSVCFAIAEHLFGAAKGYKNVIGIIVGTGIGGGLILDGKVYRGRDGGAGHIGHTTIDLSGPGCGCGQKGHFESWCSGKHIALRYRSAGGKMASPDAGKVFAAASTGNDGVARKIMEETYDKFGLALANFINTFNPEIIVLGGGVSNLPQEFYRRISAAARKYSYPAFSANVRIVKNRLGDSAGVFGAVALAVAKEN